MKNSRRVYSTESGRIRQPAPAQSGPPLCAAPQATDDGVVRIFRERGGRNGKVVTVIRGLPARDLEARATEPPWDPTEKALYVDYPLTAGGPPLQPGQAVPLPASTQQVGLMVQRVAPGQATTVHLVVTDVCGEWPTFVGGGPTAF